MKNAKFHKLSLKGDCYFDGRHRAEGTLTYFDGSEVPTCRECSQKHIKVVRSDCGRHKHPSLTKSKEKSEIPLVDSQQSTLKTANSGEEAAHG